MPFGFRVITFNAMGFDGHLGQTRIMQEVAKMSFDLGGFQEVEGVFLGAFNEHDGLMDALKKHWSTYGFEGYYGWASHAFGMWNDGMSNIARTPSFHFTQTNKYLLGAYYCAWGFFSWLFGELRYVLHSIVTITPSGDQPHKDALSFYNVHLTHHRSNPQHRIKEIKKLLDYIEKQNTDFHILVGDFNCVPNSTEYNMIINAGFVDTYEFINPNDNGYTWLQKGNTEWDKKDPQPPSRIDYIFVKPYDRKNPASNVLEIRYSRVIYDRKYQNKKGSFHLSDHFGVATDFVFK